MESTGAVMIQVELRLLGAMKEMLPEPDRAKGAMKMDVKAGSTLADFLTKAGIDRAKTLVVLVNGRYAGPESGLGDGDVVSVFPPVAGG